MSRAGIIESLDLNSMVQNWARRRLGSIDHELRVARHARTLFGLTQRWHGLTSHDCRLLLWSAMVHDVGRAWGEKRHAQRGAAMVQASGSLPVSAMERRRIAFLTRYHRGKVPPAGAEEILDRHADDSFAMRVLLGILRTADALDSRVDGTLPSTMAISSSGPRVITINGYIEGDAHKAAEIYHRPKKFRLLEETLRCQVRMVWWERMRMVG